MRRALGQRIQAGRKARAYARLLAGALADAQASADAVLQLNKDYGLSLPATTDLAGQLLAKVGAGQLSELVAATDPAVEVLALAQVPESKDGLALPASAAYGERAAEPAGDAKPAKAKASRKVAAVEPAPAEAAEA